MVDPELRAAQAGARLAILISIVALGLALAAVIRTL